MTDLYDKIDFHSYIDSSLAEKKLKIKLITEDFMKKRVDDFMKFINGIRNEYKNEYNWKEENKEYFLSGLNDKWKYSFTIVDENENLCFVNFSSVYDDIIHNHCTYAKKECRSMGLAKYHMIKLCQTGIDNGFNYQEGYWPKSNNSSIILFLKMGWEVQSIRNNHDLFMIANLVKVRNQTYELIKKENKKIII